jgi:hypothetical protein
VKPVPGAAQPNLNVRKSLDTTPQCLQSPHYHGPLAKVTNAKFGENDTIPNQLCDRGRGEKFLVTPKTARQYVDRVIEIDRYLDQSTHSGGELLLHFENSWSRNR